MTSKRVRPRDPLLLINPAFLLAAAIWALSSVGVGAQGAEGGEPEYQEVQKRSELYSALKSFVSTHYRCEEKRNKPKLLADKSELQDDVLTIYVLLKCNYQVDNKGDYLYEYYSTLRIKQNTFEIIEYDTTFHQAFYEAQISETLTRKILSSSDAILSSRRIDPRLYAAKVTEMKFSPHVWRVHYNRIPEEETYTDDPDNTFSISTGDDWRIIYLDKESLSVRFVRL
jgi:hypothetical protein